MNVVEEGDKWKILIGFCLTEHFCDLKQLHLVTEFLSVLLQHAWISTYIIYAYIQFVNLCSDVMSSQRLLGT
jgi:hypothetical protein